MPVSISVIRHAEKQVGDGPPRGVLVDGTPDPDSLTPSGWQRAGALISLFVPRGDGVSATLLPTPTRLFASELGPHSHSRRPIETLLPLSARLGVRLEEPYRQDQLDELVAAIRASDGDVLVAWEHKRIPLIANLLVGDAAAVPQVWPDERFDLVWVFEPASTAGGIRLRQVPQLLLAGDRVEPIA
ncbi:MAG: hypothetical protein NVS9B8_04140 [Candidatus Limnocylindrales bacterium]